MKTCCTEDEHVQFHHNCHGIPDWNRSSLPDPSDKDKTVVHQFSEIRPPLLTELIHYFDKLEGDVHIVAHNDKREAAKKIKAKFLTGQVVARVERTAVINKFDDEERSETWRREAFYGLRLLQTGEQNMLEGWLSSVTQEAVAASVTHNYLEIYQDKGIPLAKVSENGPTITNPEQRAGQSSNSVMNALSGLSGFQKVRYRDQDVHIYIKSVKEMVAYSLANDPIDDFFHKGYFASSRDALLKSVRDRTQDLADDMRIWGAYREVEDKAKRDFAAMIGNSGGDATSGDGAAGEVHKLRRL
ncbi:uncharacterized protein K444DRAFT_628226 [Hyaloscypha bicolor E]|uniref:Uncharacterized protein n=1 Tax=Hyaloscypha bicolor E TaxID=1095630 RepID=A0A2J6TDN0_9HELO|nr:uncharacterized protein K444DRAFT_628226 [Hyaloscypha bicolor E]PMD61137.1 hypothetical protein K444DRAFT_628226 [Hyaloscypha bicolor E]